MTPADHPRWEPVAWCADCCWYFPVKDVGEYCPGDECKRILRRRLMRICRQCEDRMGFLSPDGDLYDKHVDKEHTLAAGPEEA